MDHDGSSRGESVPGAGNTVGGPAQAARRTWVRKSAAAVMIDVDSTMIEVLGWASSDLVGKTSLDFIHPDDQTLAVENWMQMLGTDGAAPPLRFRHQHRDGSWRWVEMTNHNHLDDPSQGCVVAEIELTDDPLIPASDDLGQLNDNRPGDRPLQLHEALRAREQLLHRLAEALPVGVLHVDAHGRVLYTNQRLHTIVNRERAATFVDQLSTILAEDMAKVMEAFDIALRNGLDNDVEMRIAVSETHTTKDIRQCTLSVRALSSEGGEIVGAVASLADVTDSIRMRDELRMQATFDTLTACYNRASTMEALEKIVDSGQSLAVIFIDLDEFKGINDHLGHGAGDEMLEIVARRLRRAIREGDVVGRIGGDEFLVLCPSINSAAGALRAANRLAESLRRSVRLQDAEVSCRASIGVAWSAEGGLDGDTLIGQADAAMYDAKRSHRDRPVLYSRQG